MNLIEQLGGYEKAKDVYKPVDHLRESKTITMSDIGVEFDVGVLRCELLEYRRENNIFEVSDFVLPISSKFSNEVLELTEDYLGLDFKYKSRSGGFGFILKSFMPTKWRHATDLEIAQGYRNG